MSPLPEASILVFAPLAPRVSPQVWCHPPLLIGGTILPPRARTVTAAARVMGLAAQHRFPTSHRGLNRTMGSTRPAGRKLGGWLNTWLLPARATIVLGADDTLDRRSGRTRRGKASYRDAPRSSKQPLIRCLGLKCVALMLMAPVPWSRRMRALPCLTTRC